MYSNRKTNDGGGGGGTDQLCPTVSNFSQTAKYESIFPFFFFDFESAVFVCELLLSFEIINYQLTGPFCVRLCLFGDNQVKQKWRGELKHPKLNQNQS